VGAFVCPVVTFAVWISLFPAPVNAAVGTDGSAPRPLAALLPGRLGDWHLEDSPRLFAGDDLYKLIDGGADLYFEYGFREALSAGYSGSRDRTIKLEIYRMTDAPAAFGIYSIQAVPGGGPLKIGSEGVQYEDYALFWKGECVLVLSSADTSAATKGVMVALAETVTGGIPEKGYKPEAMDLLPKEGLVRSVYVRGPLSLSAVYSFGTGNLFGSAEGAIGVYPRHRLFLFRYASTEAADRQLAHARELVKRNARYSRFGQDGNIFKARDRKGTRLRLTTVREDVLVLLTDGSENADSVLRAVTDSIRPGR